MIEAMPPEMADGGYWYVVEAVPDPELGGQTPGDIPGGGWCAWYSAGMAVVRCPDVVGIASQGGPGGLLSSGPKPRGRVGGR